MRAGSWVFAAVLLVAGCSTPQLDVSSLDPAKACALLTAPVEPALIGLPSGRATIESTQLVPATPVAVNPKPPFGPPPPEVAVIAATPEYCRVLGSITPLDGSAPPIRFQVNLPTAWNQGALQFGGGGFNGVLITGV